MTLVNALNKSQEPNKKSSSAVISIQQATELNVLYYS